MSAAAAPLRVVAGGICCAVGYEAEAANCALRAGLDHFRESAFVSRGGDPVRVACLPETDTWGAARLGRWTGLAIAQCLAAVPPAERDAIPAMLVGPDPERPMNATRVQFETLHRVQDTLRMRFARSSRLFPGGRAALGAALAHAWQLLARGEARRVLLAGFDSYLDAATINHYLHAERLLVPGNRDGFLPGEAAAAVLLEVGEPTAGGLHLVGLGLGEEPGRPDGSVPSRAQGLSHAIRAALAEAGIDANALEFRLSDQNGEAFFAREAANALTRAAEPGGRQPITLTTADCTGEIGAATGPLMLAWLHRLLPLPDAPGRCGLIHLASDQGARCALVVRQHP